MPKYSYEPQKRAVLKHMDKLVSIHLHLRPEDKQKIVDAAKAHGMTITEYILEKTIDPSH